MSLHPFERAKLGKAPFRCVGCRENWFVVEGAGGYKKPGGSCNYCGTGILYEYVIESSDGASFVVGCDCVQRVGGDSNVSGFRDERLKFARGQREIKAAGRKAKREEAYVAGREARAAINSAAWLDAHADLDAALKAYAGPNEFVRDMAAAVAYWGGLTPGQASAVERSMAIEKRQAELVANAKHVGQLGKRMSAEVKVVFCKEIAPYAGVYPPKRRFIVKLETAAGDQLVNFGGHAYHVSEEFFAIKCTPKEFGEYQGVKQTVVQRLAEF